MKEKVASFSIDDLVAIRVALNNAERGISRLSEDPFWKAVYQGELEQIQKAKQIIQDSLN
jgi:hypothetical protein